jgi:hypothetical protein
LDDVFAIATARIAARQMSRARHESLDQRVTDRGLAAAPVATEEPVLVSSPAQGRTRIENDGGHERVFPPPRRFHAIASARMSVDSHLAGLVAGA